MLLFFYPFLFCFHKAIKCIFFFMRPGNCLTCFHCNLPDSTLQILLEGRRCVFIYLQRTENRRVLHSLCRDIGKWESSRRGLMSFASECKSHGFAFSLFQLSQGSPEPIEPNFFTADYHLLRHSAGGNSLSPNDPTGNSLRHRKFPKEILCSDQQLSLQDYL